MADVECSHFEIASGGAARGERRDKNSRDDSSGKDESHRVLPRKTAHTKHAAPKMDDVWIKNRTSMRPAPRLTLEIQHRYAVESFPFGIRQYSTTAIILDNHNQHPTTTARLAPTESL